jgi:hypothetical protein
MTAIRHRAQVAAALVTALAACDRKLPHAVDVGQWIWSVADSARFAEAARVVPDLVPTVWVGTVRGSRGAGVQSQLARSPRIAGRERVAVIVRFDDSFSSVWSDRSDSLIAYSVDASLRSILAASALAGVTVTEVQLDYDCPERLLGRWSVVVAHVASGALLGRTVWLTSLVAHLRHNEYGDLFRTSVAGHIVQVFDTGDRMSLSQAREIERLASRQRMPFRLGVAAFERQLANGCTTAHRAWFGAPRIMIDSPWYRGLWIFPGGRSWVSLLQPSR